MKKLIALFALLTLLVASIVITVSASTSAQPNDKVEAGFGTDRDFYLLPGTRNAYQSIWQTFSIKDSGSANYAGVDFSAGDAYWWDFDYYRDENVKDIMDVRLRNNSGPWVVFQITKDGKISTDNSTYFKTDALNVALPGYGWHHISAKYFQTHTEGENGYVYRYGLTVYLNGKEAGTIYASSASAATIESKDHRLYSHNGTSFVNNTTQYSYFYGSGIATTQGNTSNYLLLRDIEVTLLTDAQHAERYKLTPVYYKNLTQFQKTESVNASEGDAIHVPGGFSPFTDEAGNAATYDIVGVKWYYTEGETAPALPTLSSTETKIFYEWCKDESYSAAVTKVDASLKNASGEINVYARFITPALAKWYLAPGEYYNPNGDIWQSGFLGETAHVFGNGESFAIDFDYYYDPDTVSDATLDIRLRRNKATNGLFRILEGKLQYNKGYVVKGTNNSTYVDVCDIGEIGWHHVTVTVAQTTDEQNGYKHSYSVSLSLDGREVYTYAPSAAAISTYWEGDTYAWRLYENKYDDEGNWIGYKKPDIGSIKFFFFGSGFYNNDGATDMSEHLLMIKNACVTFGYRDLLDVSKISYVLLKDSFSRRRPSG